MKIEDAKNVRFGDTVENLGAAEDNPTRIGIFVEWKGRHIRITDGDGDFWETRYDADRLIITRS